MQNACTAKLAYLLLLLLTRVCLYAWKLASICSTAAASTRHVEESTMRAPLAWYMNMSMCMHGQGK